MYTGENQTMRAKERRKQKCNALSELFAELVSVFEEVSRNFYLEQSSLKLKLKHLRM
jgi:hypothetical protein